MKILKKLASTSLVVRILAGLVVGAVLGLVIPGEERISIFGDLFVSALKAVAPVLVFVLVSASLASAKGGHAEKFRSVSALLSAWSRIPWRQHSTHPVTRSLRRPPNSARGSKRAKNCHFEKDGNKANKKGEAPQERGFSF